MIIFSLCPERVWVLGPDTWLKSSKKYGKYSDQGLTREWKEGEWRDGYIRQEAGIVRKTSQKKWGAEDEGFSEKGVRNRRALHKSVGKI